MTAAADWPLEGVRITCDHCKRSRHYSKKRFVELVGEETPLNDALRLLSEMCPQRRKDTDPMRRKCRPYYVDDWWDTVGRGELRTKTHLVRK